MLKKFNSFMNLSIITSLLCIIIGIFFIAYPKGSIRTISYLVASVMIIFGIIMIARFNDRLFFIDLMTVGILLVVLGIIILLNPNLLETIIPICIGIYIVVNATIKVRLSLTLKKYEYRNWLLPFVFSLLSLLCGIIMIIRPEIGIESITMLVGILIIIYAVSDIIDLIVFKKNVNIISKEFK